MVNPFKNAPQTLRRAYDKLRSSVQNTYSATPNNLRLAGGSTFEGGGQWSEPKTGTGKWTPNPIPENVIRSTDIADDAAKLHKSRCKK